MTVSANLFLEWDDYMLLKLLEDNLVVREHRHVWLLVDDAVDRFPKLVIGGPPNHPKRARSYILFMCLYVSFDQMTICTLLQMIDDCTEDC